MSISRLRMGTDGDGISTLVGMFGCPLHCRYCINDHCHEGKYTVDNIPRGKYSPLELLEVLETDDIYFRMTGGGIVFGGGEPLLQASFIYEVCRLAPKSWKRRIETSLHAPWVNIEELIEDIDQWIIDVKTTDALLYKEYTGGDVFLMQQNLIKLSEAVASDKLHIRVPRIPNYNEYDNENIEQTVRHIKSIVDVEPEIFTYYVPPRLYDENEEASSNIRSESIKWDLLNNRA